MTPCTSSLFSKPVLGLICGIALLPGGAVLAETYRSAKQGYSIDVPEGWVQVPMEAVQEKLTAEQSQLVDVMFEPPDHDTWFSYPHVVIRVIPYKGRLSEDRQPYDDELPQFVEEVTGLDVDRLVKRRLDAEARPATVQASLGQVNLDPDARSFSMSMQRTSADDGELIGMLDGFFGHRAIVTVTMVAEPHNVQQLGEVRAGLRESFRFDPGHVFVPGTSPSEPRGSFPVAVSLVLVAAVVFVAV